MANDTELQGPYGLGQNHWPGLSKLVEELGELQEVLGKIMANGGKVRPHIVARLPRIKDVPLPGDPPPKSWRAASHLQDESDEPDPDLYNISVPEIIHYDNRPLLRNLRDELADVRAAITFFLNSNDVLSESMTLRKNGDMVNGQHYIDERTKDKYRQFTHWHQQHYRYGQWVPGDGEDLRAQREKFIADMVAQLGPAGFIAAMVNGEPTEGAGFRWGESQTVAAEDITSGSIFAGRAEIRDGKLIIDMGMARQGDAADDES